MAIEFYLSGGRFNAESSKSLGGNVSVQTLSNSRNNLFTKVPSAQSSKGATVYRCLYVVNEGTALQNVRVSLANVGEDNSSDVLLGVSLATAVQQVYAVNAAGGTFTLRYTAPVDGSDVSQTTNPIAYDSNVATLASNLQTALNDLTLLSDVIVIGLDDGVKRLTVTFSGSHANRFHKTLEVVSNSLTGDNVILGTKSLTKGSPINATAPDIGFENEPPFNTTFSSSEIGVGILNNLDGFPIWLKKTNESLALTGDELDTLTLRVLAVD